MDCTCRLRVRLLFNTSVVEICCVILMGNNEVTAVLQVTRANHSSASLPFAPRHSSAFVVFSPPTSFLFVKRDTWTRNHYIFLFSRALLEFASEHSAAFQWARRTTTRKPKKKKTHWIHITQASPSAGVYFIVAMQQHNFVLLRPKSLCIVSLLTQFRIVGMTRNEIIIIIFFFLRKLKTLGKKCFHTAEPSKSLYSHSHKRGIMGRAVGSLQQQKKMCTCP